MPISKKFDSYIICTSPRSGSTLLCKLLAATNVAGNPESYFHLPAISKWLQTFGLEHEVYGSEFDRLSAIFDAARKCGSAGTDMFGLRLQQASSDFLMQQLKSLYPNKLSDLGRIQEAFGKTLFIYLFRANKLDQAVSIVKANQTGLWHMAADGTELERRGVPAVPCYDADAIAQKVEEFLAMELAWNEWFAREGITPMRISYDGLSSDPISQLKDILLALGLDPATADGIDLTVKKLADATNRNWVERFQAETS